MIGSVGSTSAWGTQSLSASSAAQRHKESFKQLDSDGDGKVTASELQAGIPANGKGPDVSQILKQVDTDGDGSISEKENDAFITKMGSNKKPLGPPPSGGKGSVSGTSGSKKNSSQIFDELDTNKDGVVSLQESMAAKPDDVSEADAKKMFSQIDSNGDGSIDKAENESFFKKIQQQMETMMQNAQSYNNQGQQQLNGVGSFVNFTI